MKNGGQISDFLELFLLTVYTTWCKMVVLEAIYSYIVTLEHAYDVAS
jgi:hypothetical protein